MEFVPPPPPMDDVPPPPPLPRDGYGLTLTSASATCVLPAMGPGSPATQYLEVAEGLLQRGDVDGFRDVLEAAVARQAPGAIGAEEGMK